MTYTHEQLAGQRLIVGFDGTSLNDDLKFLINNLKVGGLILFARNIESPDQVRDFCKSLQDYAKTCNQPKLFIAIDQEGGQVERLKHPFPEFPHGNPGMNNAMDAQAFADTIAKGLTDLGITMNMAPVMDVEPEGFTGVMNKRVFRGGPQYVSDMGTLIIHGFQKKGLMAVAKHFPGIGRTTLDSHLTLPVLETPMAELAASDFIPFEAAINAQVSGIMLSHIQYTAIDPEWPASLSENVVKNLLRGKMGFDGLVMTDDLDMKAIRVPIETSVERIMKAGVDIALICHKGPDIENAFKMFHDSISRSEEARQATIESVERVMRLKHQYLCPV